MRLDKARVIRIFLALIFIFTLNFIIPRIMPGDPLVFLVGEDVVLDKATIGELRAELELDLPMWRQYINYWGRVVLLDFGYSYHYNQKVSELILSRMPWTLGLLLPSTILGAFLGIVLGALSGWGKNTPLNRIFTTLNLAIYSTPPYFLAMICLYLFSMHWQLFPIKGFYLTGTFWNTLHHFFLPVVIMTAFSTSRNVIVMRGSVMQEKDKWYVLYARAKGISGYKLLFRHVFKNAALPMVTMIALDFGFLFSGALLVETVFSMNGMGTLIYDAVLSRDYPLLQGIFLVITLMVVFANLAAEVCYHWLDPRIKRT
jgi:peptide/nickel transport system permease protein